MTEPKEFPNCDCTTVGFDRNCKIAGRVLAQMEPCRPAIAPQGDRESNFESAEALADWLESLHETNDDGAVTDRVWEPAQRAAAAIRADQTPPELLASRLIDAWCDAHDSKITWRKAVEITGIITKLPAAEVERLMAMDDAPQATPAAIAELIEAAGARPVMDGRGFHIEGRTGKRYTEVGSFQFESLAQIECSRILAGALAAIPGAPQ